MARHKEHKLNGIVEFALNMALYNETFLEEAAGDPNIEQNTPTEVFQALESYIVEELALTVHNT